MEILLSYKLLRYVNKNGPLTKPKASKAPVKEDEEEEKTEKTEKTAMQALFTFNQKQKIKLQFYQGPLKGKEFPFKMNFGDEVSIGSAPDNQIVIEDPANINPYHALIRLDYNQLFCIRRHPKANNAAFTLVLAKTEGVSNPHPLKKGMVINFGFTGFEVIV